MTETPNPLAEVLAAVLASGEAPTRDTIRALPLTSNDVHTRGRVRQQMSNALGQLAAIVRDGESPATVDAAADMLRSRFGDQLAEPSDDLSVADVVAAVTRRPSTGTAGHQGSGGTDDDLSVADALARIPR